MSHFWVCIDWFSLYSAIPSKQQRFFCLRTKKTQGVLGPWVSSFYFGWEISLRLTSEECVTLPSSNLIFMISSINCFSPIKRMFLTTLVFWLRHRAVSSTLTSTVQCCFSVKQIFWFEKDQIFRNVSKTNFAQLFESKSSKEWRCFLAGVFLFLL